MSTNLFLLIMLIGILALSYQVGITVQTMYKNYFRDYKTDDPKMMYLEHIRNGLFVIFDTTSDLFFTGTHEQLLDYKRTKKSIAADMIGKSLAKSDGV